MYNFLRRGLKESLNSAAITHNNFRNEGEIAEFRVAPFAMTVWAYPCGFFGVIVRSETTKQTQNPMREGFSYKL